MCSIDEEQLIVLGNHRDYYRALKKHILTHTVEESDLASEYVYSGAWEGAYIKLPVWEHEI